MSVNTAAIMQTLVNNHCCCRFDDQRLQTFTSCLFLAGLVASFPAAWVTTWKGRKKSMVISGAAYMAGSVILTAAMNLAMLYIGRVLLGIGVGFAIQVLPIPP